MPSSYSVSAAGSATSRGWGVSVLLLPVVVFFGLNPGGQPLLDAAALYLHASARFLLSAAGAGVAAAPVVPLAVPVLLVCFFFRRRYRTGVQVFLVWFGQASLFLSRAATEVAPDAFAADWAALLDGAGLPATAAAALLAAQGLLAFGAALLLPLAMDP